MKRISLIELAGATAVLMTIAAIALPALHRATLRAQRAELYTVTDALRSAEASYELAYDHYVLDSPLFPRWMPDDQPGKTLRSWANPTELQLDPPGSVRGSYALIGPEAMTVWSTGTGATEPLAMGTAWHPDCPPQDVVCIVGTSDLDEDGTLSWVRSVRTETPKLLTTADVF